LPQLIQKMSILPLPTWINKTATPLVIAGPCSAETEEQVIETCKLLAQTGKVSALRAGIWKPRTRPGSFEGVGEIGLTWLKNAGLETGLKVTTEVATAKHVELALEKGIDILWIGARTTANPFSVQEIADALKGCDVPVMIKNPINPDINLWVGAIERLSAVGINQLAAIHRGFSSFEKTKFRYAPMWEYALELKTIFPEIPIICDPSHISGNNQFISVVAQRAIDLDMDGLMIESHINPKKALSDAKQQVTPDELLQIINHLVIRKPDFEKEDEAQKIEELRKVIDQIDAELIEKLVLRMNAAEKIGQYKKQNNITIFQIKRWKEIIASRSKASIDAGLGETFIKNLLQLIHKESIRRQNQVMNDNDMM
jgi:chorismate mutase